MDGVQNSLTINSCSRKEQFLQKSYSFPQWPPESIVPCLIFKTNITCVVFLLPRCMCHQGCIQAQRPAGRASWPAALCTSSLLHIWMYLRSTTNHQNHYTSQRPMIQPAAQLFSYAAHKYETSILKKSVEDVESHR